MLRWLDLVLDVGLSSSAKRPLLVGMPIKSIPGSCFGKDNEEHYKELSLLVMSGIWTNAMMQKSHPVEQTRILQARGPLLQHD